MRRILGLYAVMLATIVMLALTGCGSTAEGGNGHPDAEEKDNSLSTDGWNKEGELFTQTFEQTLPDGRTVLCVYATHDVGGGISCDWDTAE